MAGVFLAMLGRLGAETLGFSEPSYSVNEGNGSLTVTVTRSGSGVPLAVNYATVAAVADPFAQAATEGQDYAGASGTLNFTAEQTSRTFVVTILQDTVGEPQEKFDLLLSNPSGATLGRSNVPVFIHDDDGGGSALQRVQFSAARFFVNEDSGMAEITVVRDGGAGVVAVDYATRDATARAGQDYSAAAGTLEFLEGESEKSFMVPVTDDDLVEGNELVRLRLSNPTGAAKLGTRTSATLTIRFNDGEGELEFAAPVFAANERGKSAKLKVVRNGSLRGSVAVSWTTRAGTADATDYEATSGTVVFGVGSRSRFITVPLLQDGKDDVGKVFYVDLSGPSGKATLGAQSEAAVVFVRPNLVLSRKMARPGQRLKLIGKFDPSLPAVVVFADLFGNELRLDAKDITGKTATVLVPPFFNPQTGAPDGARLAVSVEQGGAVLGPVAGFEVQALADSGESPGAFTLALLDETIRITQASEDAWLAIEDQSGNAFDTAPLRAALAAMRSHTQQRRAEIAALAAGNAATIPLGAAGGRAIMLDAAGLDVLDRITRAYFLEGPPTSSASARTALRRRLAAPVDEVARLRDALAADGAGSTSSVLEIFGKLNEIAEDSIVLAEGALVTLGRVPVGAVVEAGGLLGGAATWAFVIAPDVMAVATYAMASPFVTLELGRAPDREFYAPSLERLRQQLADYAAGKVSDRFVGHILDEVGADAVLRDIAETLAGIIEDVFDFTDSGDPGSPVSKAFDHAPTIFGNRPLPVVSVDDVSVKEPASGTAGTGFFLTLSSSFPHPVTVHYSTIPGSAGSADFVGKSGSVTFPPGITAKAVAITIKSDNVVESDETFFLTLTSAEGATIGDGSGTCTIQDRKLNWTITGNVSVDAVGIAVPFGKTLAFERKGGTKSFPLNPGTATVTITGSTVSVKGGGFGSQSGVTCTGNGAGSAPIVENAGGFSASGAITGTLKCTFSDGSKESYAITGSFTATAPK